MSLFLLQPSSAPGREGSAAPAPAPAGEGQPAGPAGPPPDPGFLGGQGMMLLPLLLFVGFMLWQSRSQQKKQKELEEGLKPGIRVLTNAGIVGKIVEMGDRTVRIEVAPGVHVTFLKSAIQGQDPTVKKDESKAEGATSAKSKDAAKDESKKDK